MKLYHFTAKHFVPAIIEHGLTLGMTPIGHEDPTDPEFFIQDGWVQGTQWLTSNPDGVKQAWASRVAVPYSRTAARLTVEIPFTRRGHLRPGVWMVDRYGMPAKALSLFDGSQDWWVYLGSIKPQWIKAVDVEIVGEREQ